MLCMCEGGGADSAECTSLHWPAEGFDTIDDNNIMY